MEIEVYANDPLNEGFGFRVRISFEGEVVKVYDITRDEAYRLMGSLVATSGKGWQR